MNEMVERLEACPAILVHLRVGIKLPHRLCVLSYSGGIIFHWSRQRNMTWLLVLVHFFMHPSFRRKRVVPTNRTNVYGDFIAKYMSSPSEIMSSVINYLTW